MPRVAQATTPPHQRLQDRYSSLGSFEMIFREVIEEKDRGGRPSPTRIEHLKDQHNYDVQWLMQCAVEDISYAVDWTSSHSGNLTSDCTNQQHLYYKTLSN